MNEEHPDFDYTPEECEAWWYSLFGGKRPPHFEIKELVIEPFAVEEVTQND